MLAPTLCPCVSPPFACWPRSHKPNKQIPCANSKICCLSKFRKMVKFFFSFSSSFFSCKSNSSLFPVSKSNLLPGENKPRYFNRRDLLRPKKCYTFQHFSSSLRRGLYGYKGVFSIKLEKGVLGMKMNVCEK